MIVPTSITRITLTSMQAVQNCIAIGHRSLCNLTLIVRCPPMDGTKNSRRGKARLHRATHTCCDASRTLLVCRWNTVASMCIPLRLFYFPSRSPQSIDPALKLQLRVSCVSLTDQTENQNRQMFLLHLKVGTVVDNPGETKS